MTIFLGGSGVLHFAQDDSFSLGGGANGRSWRWVLAQDGSGGTGGGVHAVEEGAELGYAAFGFAAVGGFVGGVPAGGFALFGELDDDAVAAGKDVEVVEDEAVVDLGLGDEPADLASHRGKALVAKQRAGAVAGAVEEDALGECAELGGGVELAGDDFAASEEELFGELVAVGGDVEHELGGAAGEAGGEGMGAGGEVEGAGGDVLDEGHVAGEADGVFGVAALEVLLGGSVGEVVTVGELDGGAGQGEEALVGVPGAAGHPLPLPGEGGGGVFGEGDAGVGGPGAGGAEGAGVVGAFLAVDGDGAAAGALEEDGGGEAEGSAADDGDVLAGGVGAGEGLGDGDFAGAPGEGPTGAAVAVVMDDEFVWIAARAAESELFGLDARADGAKGAEADGDLEEAVFVGADGREGWDGVVEGEGWGGGGMDHSGGAAGEEAAGGEGSGGVEEVAAVHEG